MISLTIYTSDKNKQYRKKETRTTTHHDTEKNYTWLQFSPFAIGYELGGYLQISSGLSTSYTELVLLDVGRGKRNTNKYIIYTEVFTTCYCYGTFWWSYYWANSSAEKWKKEIHSDINKAELGNGNIQCPWNNHEIVMHIPKRNVHLNEFRQCNLLSIKWMNFW